MTVPAREVRAVFGPPGTGKTTSLIRQVEDLLEAGVRPERIAFVTFTRKAAAEARERAAERFGFGKEALRHWSTLHSLAFRSLGLTRDQMLTGRRMTRFCEEVGLETTGEIDEDGRPPPAGGTSGDLYLRLHALARARRQPLCELACQCDLEMPLWALERFSDQLAAHKRREGLYGFEDLLEADVAPLEADHVFVDECQDLTPQQIAYLRAKLLPGARLVFAGDDDQAIYGWAGADVTFMSRLRAERTVLPQSHRLPRTVKSVADEVLRGVGRRVPKTWSARDDEGVVDRVAGLSEVVLTGAGSWLLLARQRARLADLVAECRRQGVVYRVRGGSWSNEDDDVRAVTAYERLRAGEPVTAAEARLVARAIVDMTTPARMEGVLFWDDLPWPDGLTTEQTWMSALTRLPAAQREYVRELRRNKEPLRGPGRVTVSTVHGAKGGEADNVFLVTDVGRRVAGGFCRDPDGELRVLYVAVTRARERLLLARPGTLNHWRV